MQNHAVIADRPALFRGRKIHSVEVAADRDTGLLPLPAGIVGIKNVATLPDRDQARAGIRHVEQRAAHRQCTGLGGQVQHIDVPRGLRKRLPHHQHQQRERFE
ncbi:hypothetical protein D3C84_1114770 [compost metagenome]